MTTQLYVLYEHASGYGLFHVDSTEDIGALLPIVSKSITEYTLFASTVKLISFSPFKSGINALDNINAVSEGIVHDDLKLFLSTNLPESKDVEVNLGIGDTRISGTIFEEVGVKCVSNDAVNEVIRGLRLHFPNMIKGLSMVGEAKAQLGLGHSYSRAKVKFNVNRTDNMIIQSIALLDQLDKDINTFSMRVKEWYSYHFPELMKIVGDNYMYCRLAKLLGNRKDMAEDILEKIEEITMDSGKSAAIVSASKMSMGMDVSPIDLINIMSFSSRVISLTEYRKSLVDYLHKRMASVAPNLSTLIGDVVGARLISHAGSLTSLAKYPASTVQILGAEKALFRALKNKGNTPKYGLIFHSTFIGRAGAKNKGRISRYLANKCSIASRIDCFTDHPNTVFGEKLRDQVENRLKFYESNGDETPMKNADVMKEAIEASNALISKEMEETKMDVTAEAEVAPKKKKKKKKSKPDADSVEEVVPKVEDTSVLETPKSEKKKKKKKDVDAVNDSVADDANLTKSEKKKKKKKNKVEAESVDAPHTNGDTEEAAVDTPKKKKKKMKRALDENGVSAVTPKKKKKTTSAE